MSEINEVVEIFKTLNEESKTFIVNLLKSLEEKDEDQD